MVKAKVAVATVTIAAVEVKRVSILAAHTTSSVAEVTVVDAVKTIEEVPVAVAFQISQ